MKTMAAMVAAVATAAVLAASTAQGQALRVGAGTRSCAEFNADYADNPALAEGIYFSWAQGYLVGFSEAASGGSLELDLEPGGLVTARQREFVRGYCRRHPDTRYHEAVEALFLRVLDNN